MTGTILTIVNIKLKKLVRIYIYIFSAITHCLYAVVYECTMNLQNKYFTEMELISITNCVKQCGRLLHIIQL
jgi:hypothetical protein